MATNVIAKVRHGKMPLYFSFFFGLIILCLVVALFYFYSNLSTTQQKQASFVSSLKKAQKELLALKNQDQYKINKDLEARIKSIETSYSKASKVYEQIVDHKITAKDTKSIDALFALTLSLLSKRNYASAEATLASISAQIATEKAALAGAGATALQNVVVNNTPPGSGFARQGVKTDIGTFTVDLVAADLNTTKVIIDTASEKDCANDCPVLPLADYVSRSGAFAGINGSYFCPASYPSCAGKTNSFDTLLMNKNKTYFNSDNNVYSTVPVVVFYGTTARFISRSLDWGRDTSIDGVIANQPLILLDGNITFDGDGDPKKGSKGSRSFVGSKGSTVYIGVVHNVTVGEMAIVLKTLGLQNALNLDSGGSTALWSGGYKVGPGRNIPNAVLLVRK